MTSLASLSSRFPFEPNAAFGREYVDIGGNIIMTEDGCEVLNVMPTAMRLVREVEGEGICFLSLQFGISPPGLGHGSGQHERSR